MENIEPFILDLMLMMFSAGIVALLFKKLKQPVVLAYIIAGFLISPNFKQLPTVVSVEDISMWSELGIIFLMFGLGLEFSFKKIAEVGGSAIITALTVMSAMIGVGFAVGKALGWGQMDAIFLGGMLSMSSTMIILKTYEELGKKKENYASVVLGALVIEDIGGIFMMIILTTISVSQGSENVGDIAGHLLELLLFLVLWFAIGIYLIPTIIRKTKNLMNDEMLLIVSIAICLVMVIMANIIGFSSALGAFMAGSILAGTITGEKIDKVVKPVKDMFGAVFFISVGMLIQPDLLVKYIGPIILITIVTIIGQMLFSTVGMLIAGHTLKTAVSGGFSMVQIGEFSFILAALGTNLGVTSDFLYPIVVCVSVITAFSTPVFIKNSNRAYNFINKILPDKAQEFLMKYTSDRRSSSLRESEWIEYLKRYAVRTLLCGGGMLVTYIVGTRWAAPLAEESLGTTFGYPIVLALMMVIIIALTAVMHWKRSMRFTKLWLANPRNKLPLATLQAIRSLICIIIIFSTIEHFYKIPVFISVIIGLVAVGFVLKSNFMSSTAIKMELRFLSNFSEKQLAMRKKDRMENGKRPYVDEQLHVCEVIIVDEPKRKTVKELTGNRWIDILIIKIVREDRTVINIPDAETEIRKGDVLHILGKEDAISSFLMIVDNVDTVEQIGNDYVTLKEYRYAQIFNKVKDENTIMCCPIPVYKESSFSNKTIRNCGFRKNYKGVIIGIERNNFPIVYPNIDMYIEPGDLMWVIGTNEMADKLLLRGLLEEQKIIKY